MLASCRKMALGRGLRVAPATVRRCAGFSRPSSPPPAPSAPSVASRGRGRRHDAARKAALEARPGRDRPPGGPASAGVGARLGDEREDDDGRDGRARSSAARAARAQRARREPRLRRRLRARSRPAAPSSGSSRSTRPRCPRPLRRLRPRAVCLGNLFRDQLDRYGELELVAERWRDAVARLDPTLDARRQRRRPAGRRARAGRAGALSSSGSTTRATPARRSSTRPTRSTASAAARPTTTPRPTSGTSATTAARAAATRGRRSTSSPATIELAGSTARAFDLVAPGGTSAASRFALPGLYNVYNALAAASLALALGAPLDEIASRARALRRRVRPLRADRDRRPAAAHAADQESGRRERGDPHAARGRRRRASLVIALNDAIADGRDVSWIWDVDFEPLLGAPRAGRRDRRPRRRARAAVRLRRPPARPRSRSCPTSSGALDRGLELTPRGRRARRPPDLHGDARAARDRRRARPRAAVLGGRGVKIVVGHLYPGVPEHLRRPRQHRGARRGGRRWRGHELEVRADRPRRRARAGRARPVLRRRRPGSRAGARSRPTSPRKAEALREAVDGRRRLARRLRRLPAARPRRTGTSPAPSCPARAPPARDRRRRPPDDRRRAPRVRARAGRASDASPASRTTRAGRCSTRAPSRSAASSHGFGNDGECGFEGCRVGPRRSARTCTARCCRATRGSPTGCWRRRSPIAPAASPAASSLSRCRRRARAEAHARLARPRAQTRGGRRPLNRRGTAASRQPTARRGRRPGRPAASALQEALDRRMERRSRPARRARTAGARARPRPATSTVLERAAAEVARRR